MSQDPAIALASHGILSVHFQSPLYKRSVATLMKQRILLSLALQFAMLALAAMAQQPKVTPVPPTPQAPTAGESRVSEPPHELTADDVHAFLDGFVPMQLEREDIAGAVVLVVKDGAIL